MKTIEDIDAMQYLGEKFLKIIVGSFKNIACMYAVVDAFSNTC